MTSVERGIRRTRAGARLTSGDVVLGETLSAPGPTHTPLDVMAAAVRVLAPGPRIAVLGFGAGGLMAPLRALGANGEVRAVDRALDGEAVYRKLAREWGGEVAVDQGDAADWLRLGRGPFDVIVEDLSEPGQHGGEVKPWISVSVLPELASGRLAPRGILVTNALPWPGTTWKALLANLRAPFPSACVITFADWENRVLVAGSELRPARRIAPAIGAALRGIGSRCAGRIRVRALEREVS